LRIIRDGPEVRLEQMGRGEAPEAMKKKFMAGRHRRKRAAGCGGAKGKIGGAPLRREKIVYDQKEKDSGWAVGAEKDE